MLILLFKVNTNAGTAGTGDRGLKLLYFFKLTQIGFHFFDQHIHLLQGTTIRKRCIGRQHHLFITCEIAAFVYLFNKKAKAASKSFVYNRFYLLFIGGTSQCFVVSLSHPIFPFHFFRKKKNRKSEKQHQQNTNCHTPTTQYSYQPCIEARKMYREAIKEMM